MRLKKIELHGFKSFANRTEIQFEQGVTAIAGPNGCGKSNVVDAIKWVLGTLSHKEIRGDEMMDVIFKGAEGVAPLGFAEVSLTLLNGDHILPIEYDEVTVTRRLFRSGESEYLINKTQCRLKDIRELFYGTGIGTNNYSLIEQGKIDRLILSNPYERRLVFDEACGISKYRVKKAEAESKLEKVSQDLLRLGDVVREVSREMRSIKIQAGRAAKYRELQEDLKNKKKLLASHQYGELLQRYQNAQNDITLLSEEKSKLEVTISDINSKISQYEEVVNKLEEEYRNIGIELANADSKRSFLRQSIEQNTNRLEEIRIEKERFTKERDEVEAGIARLNDELARSKCEMDSVKSAIALCESRLKENRAKLTDAENECDNISKSIDAKKAELIELIHRETKYQNELTQMLAEKKIAKARTAKVSAKRSELEVELFDIQNKLLSYNDKVNAIEGDIEGVMSNLTNEEINHKGLKDELNVISSDLSLLQEEKDRKIARRELLTGLDAQFEGLDSGTKEILQYNISGYPGVLGTVADFIYVDARYVRMVEAILGDRAGYVVVETFDEAREIANYVMSNNIGKVGILWLGNREDCLAQSKMPSDTRTPYDCIRVDDRFSKLARYLLGSYIVAESIDEGYRIIEDKSGEYSVVTVDGDIIEHNGVIRTHSANNGCGILSRKVELKRLEVEIEELLQSIAEKSSKRSELEDAVRSCESVLESSRHSIYEKNVEKLEMTNELNLLSRRKKLLDEECENIELEMSDIVCQLASFDEKEMSINKIQSELKALKDGMDCEIGKLENTMRGYAGAKKGLIEENNSLEIDMAKVVERVGALSKAIAKLETEIDDNQTRIQNIVSRILQLDDKVSEITIALKDKNDEMAKISTTVEGFKQRITSVACEKDNGLQELIAIKDRYQKCYGALRETNDKLQRMRLTENEHKIKLSNLIEKVKEELCFDISADQSYAVLDSNVDLNAIAKDIDEIKAKIDSIGSVNLLSIDRLKELEDRHTILTTQEADLVKSKEKLMEFIRDINRESRELFEKTLSDVKVSFNELFRKLFSGGKAEITLLDDGVDIMSAGIEVLVKPPQKELTKISLLSGGEKTLTALALIMALFKVNPSPFCVLDEADAALDESNVNKFTGLIREFVDTTQFIVITHNKRTLAMADILYGITMERPGVSKKVTVSLIKDGSNVDLLPSKNRKELVGTGV